MKTPEDKRQISFINFGESTPVETAHMLDKAWLAVQIARTLGWKLSAEFDSDDLPFRVNIFAERR